MQTLGQHFWNNIKANYAKPTKAFVICVAAISFINVSTVFFPHLAFAVALTAIILHIILISLPDLIKALKRKNKLGIFFYMFVITAFIWLYISVANSFSLYINTGTWSTRPTSINWSWLIGTILVLFTLYATVLIWEAYVMVKADLNYERRQEKRRMLSH